MRPRTIRIILILIAVIALITAGLSFTNVIGTPSKEAQTKTVDALAAQQQAADDSAKVAAAAAAVAAATDAKKKEDQDTGTSVAAGAGALLVSILGIVAAAGVGVAVDKSAKYEGAISRHIPGSKKFFQQKP